MLKKRSNTIKNSTDDFETFDMFKNKKFPVNSYQKKAISGNKNITSKIS